MLSEALLVDGSLMAVSVTELLQLRKEIRMGGAIAVRPAPQDDRAVLTGGTPLEPDQLHAAEKNANVRYYLPRYRLATDERGRPRVVLRLQRAEGQVGSLTIVLTWTPPSAPGLEVRPLQAQVVPALSHRIPVQGASADMTTAFENRVPLQAFVQSAATELTSTTIFGDKGAFNTVYQALCQVAQAATLELTIRAHVGVRTWRQVVISPPIIRQPRSSLISTVIANQLSAPTAFSLFAEAREAPRVAAVTAVNEERTANVASMSASKQVLRIATSAETEESASEAAKTVVIANRAPASVLRSATSTVAMRARVDADAPAIRRVSGTTTTGAETGRVVSRAVKIVRESDLEIDGRRAVPAKVRVDAKLQPLIVDAELQNQQRVAFYFDPALAQNDRVFAGEGFDGDIHLLLPLVLNGPRGPVTVYRDNLRPEMVLVPPSGFRLERDAAAPFLPAITFVAGDFGTADDQDGTSLLYRVVGSYRLKPWLDPDVEVLAREQQAADGLRTQFMPNVARDAEVFLNSGASGAPVLRESARIDPQQGIHDMLELDQEAFVRLWRDHLAGSGLSGTVRYQLFDGTETTVPLLLSLSDASSELFNVAFVGPVANQPGRYRVIVTNRIESDAVIDQLPPERLIGGVAVARVEAGVIGRVLRPLEQIVVDYDVSPPDAEVLDLSPVVAGRARPNIAALLRLLVAQGYTSPAFEVTVRAADEVFTAAAPGAEPLTGLSVEFDSALPVELTPERREVTATVVGGLFDAILGTIDDSQRFFYRVTARHGSIVGSQSAWTERRGAGTFEVTRPALPLDL